MIKALAMTPLQDLSHRASELIASLSPHVTLVAAAKTRTIEEIRTVVDAGVRVIGHNYVQEAEAMMTTLDRKIECHMIGHLQRKKAAKAVEVFDAVESLDSLSLAEALEKRCERMGKVLPVLIELNSGEESEKTGVPIREVFELAKGLGAFPHLRLVGLMTMGPMVSTPEDIRPFFRLAKECFDTLKTQDIPGSQIEQLSMGMSDTFRVAIEEGATWIRVGTALFGPR